MGIIERIKRKLNAWVGYNPEPDEVEPIAAEEEKPEVLVPLTKAYVGPVDTPIDELVSGEFEVNVTGIRLDTSGAYLKMVKALDAMHDKSESEKFVELMRDEHKVPDLTQPDIAKELNVRGFAYAYNKQGYYKLVYVKFNDGSSWEKS